MYRIIIIVFAVIAFSINLKCQQDEPDYANPELNSSDINAILKSLDIEVYKFGLTLPKENKYWVTLYLNEYDIKGKIKSDIIWSVSSPYKARKDEQINYKTFDGVRIITKNNTNEFVLNLKMGDFGGNGYKIKIDSIYSKPHGIKRFQIKDTALGEGETPLILIGSYWDIALPEGKTLPDGSKIIMRFCMEDEIDPDFSNEAFKRMPHYYVLGIDVKKQE